MTRTEAQAAVLRLAASVRAEPGEAVTCLLGRVADADVPELRAALEELGAEAALREAGRG